MRLALVMLAACSFQHGRLPGGDGSTSSDDGTSTTRFAKRKSITIDRTRVGKTGAPATLADYPLLYRVTDPALALRPAGDVTDAEGDDIVFADAGGTPLAHEIEAYDPSTGRLVAWVNVPSVNTLTSPTSSVLYIYYGDDRLTTSTQRPAQVWNAGFEAVWHLDTGQDRTSHARNGVAQGATPVDGLVGGAHGFDGVDDAIRVGTWTQLTSSSFTLEVWMRPESTGLGQQVPLSFHKANSNQQSIHMRVYNDGGLRFSFFGQDLDAPAGTIALGQWHHFVGTYTSSNDRSRIYLGGDQIAEGNQGPFTAVDGAGSIGTWDGCNPCDQFFKGRLDEVRVSNVDRGPHWIATVHANISQPGAFVTTGPAEDVQ